MTDLNDLSAIKKLDPKDVYGSTGMLSKQCRQIWELAKQLRFPAEYKNVENIVLCGMGGSAYGGHIAPVLFKEELHVPLFVNSDYHLPGFADEKTLVIAASYSGSTEESLSCVQEAKQKGCKLTALTSGGELGEFLGQNNIPGVLFEAKYNPSGQPRLGTGYMVLGIIGILNAIGLINVSDVVLESAIKQLEENQTKIQEDAKTLAQSICGNIPVIMAAQFLLGNAHIMRNQFNETAKSFSAFSPLPELNHHLMEGLKNPADKKLITLFLTSNLYSEIINKRIVLTKDVVQKNNIKVSEYKPNGNDILSQMLDVLSLGAYLTFYEAILYNQDPSLIPWVDYFKEQLSK